MTRQKFQDVPRPSDAQPSKKVLCGECSAPMVLRQTTRFTTKDGKPKKFWGCSRYPDCRGIHGAHPDGRPLGIPADKETKLARIAAHGAMDKVVRARGWGRDAKDPQARKGLYIWLGRKLGFEETEISDKVHVAMFDKAMCARVVEVCEIALQENANV